MGTATVSQAPDVVYALAFCNDRALNDSACRECVVYQVDRFWDSPLPPQEQCYKNSYYYGDCTVIYSDHMLGPSDTTGGNVDDKLFQIWNLAVEIVEIAASMPMRFATGTVDTGMRYPKVYSVAQCTPDLSTGDYLSCLHLLLDKVNSTMSLRIGAILVLKRCFHRYEAYSFYLGEPMLLLWPPKHKMSKNRCTCRASIFFILLGMHA
jgi:hypothetical protein